MQKTIRFHHFSTQAVSAEERFDAFRLRIDTMFEMATLPPEERSGFEGAISSANLGTMLLSSMQTRCFSFERPRQRILRDFLDHFMLRIDLDRAPDRGGQARGLTVIDLGQPIDRRPTPEHNISLILPRHALAGPARQAVASFHGESLLTPQALFLAEHVVSLMRLAQRAGGGATSDLLALTPQLIAACLQPGRDSARHARAELDLAFMRKARDVLFENLRNPRLGPDMLARETGMSRASLYRLFEPIGGVARAIRAARLHQAIRDLRSGNAAVGSIGHDLCFSSESQFSHAFKAYYGCSPREARAALAEGAPIVARHLAGDEADPAQRVFPAWLVSL